MNQKQKIEAHYIKLIGVTLMMTAACVSDSGNKRALSFADENAREIILDQFHLLSSGHLAEVIEWENAIRQATEAHSDNSLTARYTYFKLLVADNALLSLLDDYSGLQNRGVHIDFSFSSSYKVDLRDNSRHPIENRNKYSLPTRAGPLA